MNLKEKIDRELDRLASAAGTEKRLEIATAGGDRLQCRLIAVDALACSFENFVLLTDKLADATLDEVKKLGEDLSSRLSYLLEPISPIEMDPQGCIVQMRSNPPQKDEEGTSYYELLVQRGGQISLSRYNKTQGSVRQLVPASVTREVIQRLAADFVAAVG